jgi:hypothetical protein
MFITMNTVPVAPNTFVVVFDMEFDEAALKFTTPFEYVGLFPADDCERLYPFPDLSAHVVTLDPERVIVDESAASSHNAQSPMFNGLNPE